MGFLEGVNPFGNTEWGRWTNGIDNLAGDMVTGGAFSNAKSAVFFIPFLTNTGTTTYADSPFR